jgi:hypothetical protein
MKRVAMVVVFAIAAAAAAPAPRPFEETLLRLSRVAELYRDSALGFACNETIVSTGNSSRVRFAYIFIKDDNGVLRDFRTTAKERGEEVDPHNYKVPRYLGSAYLWAFVFRSDRQPLHRFKLVGEATVADRPALKIQFVPAPPVIQGANDWAGFAWVDRDSSQLLKIEAYSPADWNARLHIVEDVAAAASRNPRDDKDPVLIEKVITEFGFEKNGMRFPSHVELVTTQTSVKNGSSDPLRERVLDKVTQDYTGFEFFSVRTKASIERRVNGEADPD